MKTFATILALAGATAAMAGCPNMCSGKGDCTADDVCQCWSGYSGYDCSQRECPMVESWALNHREGPHYYSECANAGICDRSTGTCQCFPGYEGRGCERSACPNGCSGRGTCRMIADLPNVVAGDEQTFSGALDVTEVQQGALTGLFWDQKALTACVCDGGYMGPDCSQRVCPFGDDPMTVCEQGNVEQVQQFQVHVEGAFNSAANAANIELENHDAFALRFTSYAGEEFYTAAFDLSSGGVTGATSVTAIGATADTNRASIATALEGALQGIPNFRIKNVAANTVAGENVVTTTGRITFNPRVTFEHDEGSGNSYGAQNLLTCPHPRSISATVSTFGCGAAGCQPLIPQIRVTVGQEAAADGSAKLADGTTMSFTADSVLTCGIGAGGAYQSCNGGSDSTYNGKLIVITDAADNVFARHVVGGAIGTDDVVGSIDSIDVTGITVGTGANDFVFLGEYADINTNHVVDVSAVMPGASVAFSGGASASTQYQIHYTPAQCTNAVDITKGGAIGSDPQGFDNYDVENVECSGRGECDRASGLCQCFHGYTGLNCGSQTILV